MTRNEFIEHCIRYRKSYRDIGKMVGISKTRVNNLHSKSLKGNYCDICRTDTLKKYCEICAKLVKKYGVLTKE